MASLIKFSRALLIAIIFAITACSSEEAADLKRAKAAIEKKHYRIGLGYLDQVVKRNGNAKVTIEAAREGARITFFEINDFNKAIYFYRFIVLKSTDQKERLESQKQIAEIYFNNLQKYNEAIIEYSKLQEMPHTEMDAAQYKMAIARAQYYLNNFFQAESEIEELLKLKLDEGTEFSALLLKGNILVARKEFPQAVELFKKLMGKYPKRSVEENVALVLAVCYEESADFKNAISILESVRNSYTPAEYIELRIKRLQERIKNAPGARGYRK